MTLMVGAIAACAASVPGPTQLSLGQQQKLVPPANDTLPVSLRAQPREVLQDALSAVGDETYTCRRNQGRLAWVATGTEATLIDPSRASVGTVMPNRMFSAYDGSYVVGQVTADEIVTTNTLPWQRVVAHFNAGERRGEGRFAKTTSVQRVLTSGGLPPDPRCDQEGVSLFVPYSATYLFYRAADPTMPAMADPAGEPTLAASYAQPAEPASAAH